MPAVDKENPADYNEKTKCTEETVQQNRSNKEITMGTVKNWIASQGSALFGTVLRGVILFAVGYLVIRLVIKVVTGILERSKLEKAAHSLILTLTRTILYVLLGLIVASALGVDVTGVVALASVATLAVSLAVQDMLGNLVGGFSLLYTRPFRSGDFVEIGEQSGSVVEIGMTYTKLQTPDNKIISIPNSTVAATQIVNYSVTGTRRVDVTVSVSYDAPVETVISTLLTLVDRDRTLTEPAEPAAMLTSYGESSITYTLRFWVKSEDYWPMTHEINRKLKDALAENGIVMTYPHLNVHLN